MNYHTRSSEQRGARRVGLALPAQIRIGTQLSLQGKLKDLSFKSAFIEVKNSVYLQMNDEVGFAIQRSGRSPSEPIQGTARISRIAAGEGLAIYFTQMDPGSTNRLKELLK